MSATRDATAPGGPATDEAVAARTAKRLPLACLAFDRDLRATWADDRFCDLIGSSLGELVGSSVVELVHADDLPRVAEMLAYVQEHDVAAEPTSGPVPIRYLSRDGAAHSAEMWIENCNDDPDHPGFTLLIVPETVDHRLNEAVTSIAAAVPLPQALDVVLRAFDAQPLHAHAGIVLADGRAQATACLPATLAPAAGDGGPWDDALESGDPIELVSVDDVPEPWRAAAVATGYQALWCWPVQGRTDETEAVFAIWRRVPGRVAPTPMIFLDRLASVATLAIDGERRRDQLRAHARRDPLTGLGNRTHLSHVAETGLDGAAVVYVDLDGFKSINDEHGHHTGDAVLRAVAERLRSAVRSDDIVTRVGGDEFVVVSRCDEGGAAHLAERIVRVVERPIAVDDNILRVGASAGVAMHAPGEDLDAMLRAADRAMYAAKARDDASWSLAGSGAA